MVLKKRLVLKKRGCFYRGRNKRIKRILNKQDLAKLLNAGYNKSQIAKRYNVSITTITRYINKFELKEE